MLKIFTCSSFGLGVKRVERCLKSLSAVSPGRDAKNLQASAAQWPNPDCHLLSADASSLEEAEIDNPDGLDVWSLCK